jgi:hypothetical protein
MLFNPQSFYISWRKDQQKDSFLELILLAISFGPTRKVAYVTRTVKIFDGKFLSTEENQIHGLCREEEPTHSSSLDPTPARLEDSRDSPQGPRERISTADLTHAEMLQIQELGLAATVTNTLDNDLWVDSIRCDA